MRILNDVHIGAVRAAGTTPATQLKLRQHTLDQFAALLPDNEDVMILGDLFDTGAIPMSDVLSTYCILSDWLASKGRTLYGVAGNHDLNKTSNILSSFQFLGKLLQRNFPSQYVHIEEPQVIPFGYVIPHMRNQDLFNLALEEVPRCQTLFLHCNYDNNFAAQADQSLNLSAEQAALAPVRQIVIAHEHHARDAGKVILPGNQIATSVSDWLPNRDKRFLSIDENGSYQQTICRRRSDEFIEVNWKELTVTEHKFVRVVGEAAADEATAVVNAINRLRKASDSLVITNAVNIATEGGDMVNFEQSLQSVQQFSVMEALSELMEPEEMQVLEKLCS